MKPGVAAIAALLAVAAAAPASPPTRLAPESTRVLLGVLTDSGASSADLVAAAQALGVAGETAAFPLLSRLWDWPDPEVRKVVAWALSATGDTACVRLLRRLARRDASPAVRAEAVRLLRLWPSHRTVVFLGTIAADSAEAVAVRQQAVTALGEVGDEAGLPYLDAILGDTSARLRASAATALAFFWSAGAADLLFDLLGDEDEEVRVAAARALAAAGEPSAVGPLIALVRSTARRLPGRVRQAGAATRARGNPWPDAVELERLCAPLARILAALATLDAEQALAAIDRYGRWLGPDVKAALVRRLAVVEGPGTGRLLELLEARATDADLRRAAAGILERN